MNSNHFAKTRCHNVVHNQIQSTAKSSSKKKESVDHEHEKMHATREVLKMKKDDGA